MGGRFLFFGVAGGDREDGEGVGGGGVFIFWGFLGGLWGVARLMVLVAMVLLQWLLSLYIGGEASKETQHAGGE